MEYDIVISNTCLEEIEENCKYIKETLKAEQASNRLRKKVKETIIRLKNSPKIYTQIEKTDKSGRIYRRIVVGGINYLQDKLF